jgi:hypothetical protein
MHEMQVYLLGGSSVGGQIEEDKEYSSALDEWEMKDGGKEGEGRKYLQNTNSVSCPRFATTDPTTFTLSRPPSLSLKLMASGRCCTPCAMQASFPSP